ncbi:MAG: hypothetical protein H6981_01690 [Gammaproteobacteria bacterium]|nr:hypothetical protein [Gammaproteobacteria bacterium]MCP5135500.1 hypothetical protein [Gammaproteobacteria bacterium]
MPLIHTVTPENATGQVAETYAQIKAAFGFIPNAIQLDSINPAHMARHWAGIQDAVGHKTLSGELFTTIRLLASEIEHCEYCIGLNAGMLMQMHGRSVEEIAAIKADPAAAPLNAKEKALLVYVTKILKDSNSGTADDIAALHAAGADDREIFDALTHGAGQIASDIILNAFKVDPDMH